MSKELQWLSTFFEGRANGECSAEEAIQANIGRALVSIAASLEFIAGEIDDKGLRNETKINP